MTSAVAYAVCAVGDIPNRRCKGFNLISLDPDGSEKAFNIMIVRWDRKLYGYVNRCPHQGVNLDWEPNQFLDANGTHLICGKHGSRFTVDTGECIDGRCVGEKLEPLRLSVLDGDVCVNDVVLAEADDPSVPG
jgi:nitrite reductase/ring-hydroxylating ferredoxin subunit